MTSQRKSIKSLQHRACLFNANIMMTPKVFISVLFDDKSILLIRSNALNINAFLRYFQLAKLFEGVTATLVNKETS